MSRFLSARFLTVSPVAVLTRARFAAVAFSLFAVTGAPVLAASQIGVTAALRGDVVRTASFNKQAAIGQMSSGQSVFLGDDIKVGDGGRMQVMLLDETIFTLGANSVMRIDEFVYDPADDTKNTLSTSIKRGAFRFVSGQVAKRDANAMTVKLPSATIGVRGTSVAGEVDDNGAAQIILLGPAPDNSLGLPAGAINVANDAGVIDITRPGFVTEIAAISVPPAPPQQATPTQIRQLEQALSEDAVSELADGLGVPSTEIIVQAGTDSDGDGQLDNFAANENLSNAILQATGSEGGVTNDRELLTQVAETLFADEMTENTPDGADFFRGVNLGEDIGNLLAGDFKYLGPTQLSELADFGPTGRVTFSGADAKIQDMNNNDVGSFSLTQVWDFADKRVSSAIDGQFTMSAGSYGEISGSFDPSDVQYMPFDEASGGANASFSNSFSSFLMEVDGETTAQIDTSMNGMIGGGIRDSNENIIIDGTAYVYHPTGTDLNPPGSEPEPGVVQAIEQNVGDISQFVTLSDTSIDNLKASATETSSLMVSVDVTAALSNVDRKDGNSPTASVGEGFVNIRISSTDMREGIPDDERDTPLNTAEGSIFAMKRTVSE